VWGTADRDIGVLEEGGLSGENVTENTLSGWDVGRGGRMVKRGGVGVLTLSKKNGGESQEQKNNVKRDHVTA